MDKIKLKNNYEFGIENGASINKIVHLADTEEAALAVCQQLTAENVETVEFLHGESVIGSYTGMTFAGVPARVLYQDKVCVQFGLREKTQIEKDIEALKAEQEMQNEAIDFLAMQ